MTDELDDLKKAFDAATPTPDGIAKRENIALAEKNFADLQGSRIAPRPTHQTGPLGRILNGVGTMLNVFTTRAGLATTTSLVAVGLLVVLPNVDDMRLPDGGFEQKSQTASPREQVIQPQSDTVSVQKTQDTPIVIEEPANSYIDDGIHDTLADADLFGGADPLEGEIMFEEPIANQPEFVGSIAAQARMPSIAETRNRRGELSISGHEIPTVTPEDSTEVFANAPESPLKVTTEDPVSTFSIDVDTASYAVVRSSLMRGNLPPKDAVRIEEIINYFPYAYPTPTGPHPFEPTITVAPTPWNDGTNLVHIGIQGTQPAVEDRAPLNLVFLIDTSGSMQSADKLPLLKQSFRLMLGQLRPEDEISIVTYAGSAGQVLEPTRASERETIFAALDQLDAGGSTAGQAGLQQAYQVAESMADDGEISRVILATDGDFNVGLSDPGALKDFISDKRDSGTYLSVLGFGRGNLDDATMQALAQNGNGQAAYIDTLSEAQKVLVDQLTGALFPIANDVKIQVEFNPAQIAEYRLIGYETRALNREDFANDRVDAGDIGAGHRVTAIYEVTPVGSDAIRNGPLRYSENAADAVLPTTSDELGYFKLRYKQPGEGESTLIETPIQPVQTTPSTDVRFSIAMAGFGALLRGSDYLGAWDWQDAIDLANGAKGEDAYGYRAEAVTLMRLATSLDQ